MSQRITEMGILSDSSVTNGHGSHIMCTEVLVLTEKGMKKVFNRTVLPLLLMLGMCLSGPIMIWYTATHLNGSLFAYYKIMQDENIVNGLYKVWSSVRLSPFSIAVTLGYSLFALILMKTVPGKTVSGPVTPKGNTPMYVDNGFRCYVITIAVFCMVTFFLKMYGLTPTVVYDQFGDILTTFNFFAMILILFLYIKGLYFPSFSDHGSSNNPLFDLYWGTELHPRVFDVDIKVFTNCRFGMTIWPLLCLIYALKSYEVHGFVDSMMISLILQMTYITKFFWWESGYYSTIDMMLDRAGFYICWGCIVLVPSFYPSVSLYLVNHPVHLGAGLSLMFLAAGLASIAVNYWADHQKQVVRFTKGNCSIWGRKPDVLKAEYTVSGQTKESLLLHSGFWGVSRHFHYLPEISLAFFWSVPALFDNLQPYLYVIFLIILLVHRTYRDDTKCQNKYGQYWTEYCKRVPYKILPYVY